MNNSNKGNIRKGGKVFLLFFFALIAIISFAGILNAVTANTLDSFIGWAAAVNFFAEGILIALFGGKILKDE